MSSAERIARLLVRAARGRRQEIIVVNLVYEDAPDEVTARLTIYPDGRREYERFDAHWSVNPSR